MDLCGKRALVNGGSRGMQVAQSLMVSDKMEAASEASKSVMAVHRNSVANKCASFGFPRHVTPADYATQPELLCL